MSDKLSEIFAQDKYDPDAGKLIGFGDDPPMSPKDFLRTWRPYLRDYMIGIGAQADPERFRAAVPDMPPSSNIQDRREYLPMDAAGLIHNRMQGNVNRDRYLRDLDVRKLPPPVPSLSRDAGYYNFVVPEPGAR